MFLELVETVSNYDGAFLKKKLKAVPMFQKTLS